MKKDDFLKQVHIGHLIKEIAVNKGITSGKLAAAINRYHQNSNKIYQLDDMDIEDVVRISFILDCNILDIFMEKCSFPVMMDNTESVYNDCIFTFDIDNKQITFPKRTSNCVFLKYIHLGRIIREIAEQQGLNEKTLADRLHYSHSNISRLYQQKSIKVKPLLQISHALQYNFIEKVYLSQMFIRDSSEIFNHCIIAINPQWIRITNLNDATFLMFFRRQDDKRNGSNQ
jgi:transcriptional regulator with XRE-family HTH domain